MDFEEVTVTLNVRDPTRSGIHIDGREITNVRAVFFEQRSFRDQARLELETYGGEPLTAAQIWMRQFCPGCLGPMGARRLG